MKRIDDFLDQIICGDCIEKLKEIPDESISSVVTDPPYGLSKHPDIKEVMINWCNDEKYEHNSNGFMGKNWDSFVPGPEYWKEVYRVLKPGGYLLCFAGTRTHDLMSVAIRFGGFEIRDEICWMYGCLSEDSEILTENGWKKYNDIKKIDKVFSFNLETNKLEKTKVNDIFIYDYSGAMLNFKNDNTDQLLSPKHNVIIKETKRKQVGYKRKNTIDEFYKFLNADGVKNYGSYDFPLAAKYDGVLTCGGVGFASLLGWVLSEGNFQNNAINIYQSSTNSDKVIIIRNLLKSLNIKHSEYKRKRTYKYKGKEKRYIEHQFYFSGTIVSEIKKWIPNKKPTFKMLDLNFEEREALFCSLMMGDGSKKKKIGNKYITFYQSDLLFLEWFQVLCHLSGKQGRVNSKKMCVEVHYNERTQLQSRHLKNRIKYYSGKIWCIRTKNSSFIARRNGKIFITGNSGFPKSLDVSKAIDNFKGDTKPSSEEAKQYDGYGTALKPAFEPIIVARKPIEGTVAENVLKYGTGGINIDGCRIGYEKDGSGDRNPVAKGRWPANVMLSHNEDCKLVSVGKSKGKEGGYSYKGKEYNVDGFVKTCKPKAPSNYGGEQIEKWECTAGCAVKMLDDSVGELKSGFMKADTKRNKDGGYHGGFPKDRVGITDTYGDKGGPSRFFYCAKASRKERDAGLEDMPFRSGGEMTDRVEGTDGLNSPRAGAGRNGGAKNNHPTVKPISIMRYLVRLVTPKNGIVLDPFSGSGTTCIAAVLEGFNYIGIDLTEEYCNIARKRIEFWSKNKDVDNDKQLDLFGSEK